MSSDTKKKGDSDSSEKEFSKMKNSADRGYVLRVLRVVVSKSRQKKAS